MMSLRRIFLVMLALGVGSSLTFAQLTASKSSIAFGSVTVFTPKADSFYVKNTGGTDVTVTAVSNAAGVYLVAPFSGSLTPTIVANDSFWYRVTFTPNAVGAAPADTIRVTTAAETLKVVLGGTGVNDVRLHNPRTGGQYTTSFAFVTSLAGQQRLDSITIRNLNTTNSIDVTSMTFTNPEFTVLTTLPVTINAADTAMFYLAYTGQQIGTDADALTIVHTGAATGSSPITLPVTARSVANVGLYPVRTATPYTYSDATAPLLPLDTLVLNSASSVRYGQLAVPITPLIAVDSARQGRIVVRNVGAGPIRLDSIAVGGPHFEVRATDQIPAGGIEIQAGSSYDRYFIFYFRAKVQNTAGILDTVYLYHKDTVQFSNPLKALIRAGSENRIYVTDATTGTSVAFGAVPLGTPKEAMIRIQNYRDIPLAVDSVVRVTNISQVQILQNFLTSIPAGAIDTMKLRWLTTDTTSGTFVDTVIIYSPAFTTPKRFAISGSTARTIAFSPTSPFSFGSVQLDIPKDTVIRIYNRTETNYTINSIDLARGSSSQYAIFSNTLTQPFNAGDSILIQLRYTPTVLGPAPDTIIIAHDIPTQILSTNPYRFAINGTGTIGTIDPTNYYTVDNVQGAEGVPIRSTDSTY
ncbi:MAG: choice-of-anchor D domain-containing protein, partial [Bacteroidetes bacterium]|nr:choice-of-anchor D domain-containing protein [Bacteroidota bacterium]